VTSAFPPEDEAKGPGPRSRVFVDWTLRYGRWIWTCALLLAIPATARTASLYMHLKSDVEALLPRSAPSVLAVDELRARMPGLQHLGVVVDTGDAAHVAAGERFIDDLAARVRAYPPDMVRAVRLGDHEERAFLEAHAALYADPADLRAVAERIEARRDWEVARETGASLDDDGDAPKLDFSDIEAKYKARLPSKGKADGDRYSSEELHLVLMLIEVGGFSSGSGQGALLDMVKGDIAALGGTARYAPGMKVGYSGDVAISVEELSALLADLSISSLLVIFAVIFVIVVYYQWWRSVLILVPPLLLAAVYSFTIASLPPFGVTELNSNTAFLGSIIVGNGINFGIVLLARYVEERRSAAGVRDALVTAVWSARAGTLSAAAAASASYASLCITQFRGFRQFGIIGGIGMVLSWGLAFLLVPPLTAWLDRGPETAPRPRREATRIVSVVASLVARFRVPVVALGVALTVAALVLVRGFSMRQVEYDFSKLRRADTWVSGEGYWGGRMDELLGTYLTPVVFLGDDPGEMRALEAAAKERVKTPPLADMVSELRGVSDVLPPDQDAKIALAARIREDMTPKMRSLLAPDKRDEIERLLGAEDLRPITAADLPARFTIALREHDGSMGKTVLVFPRPSKALWEGPPLVAFVGALRDLARAASPDHPARVAGSLPISADILASIQRDGPIASLAAFMGVVAVTVILLRLRAPTLYVVGALAVGVVWLAGATMALGVKINFANFIAFPITFGIGVDYAVNVISRYVQDGRRDIVAAVRTTGSAVALCSLTTTIGYASLLVAENRALYLFGLVAVLGEIACLTAALTFMPAAILVIEKTSRDPGGAPRPAE